MPTRSKLGATLNLKIDHIADGRPNRPTTPIKPKYITVHNTANPSVGADAEAHAKFVKNTGYYMYKGAKRYVSWHYTVDDDSIVRHLPLNEAGLHAGNKTGNLESVGIEICMNTDGDQGEAFERAQRLIACLCYDLDLDPDKAVKPHMHWSGKKCPQLLLDNGELGVKWSKFIAGINSIIASIDEPPGM